MLLAAKFETYVILYHPIYPFIYLSIYLFVYLFIIIVFTLSRKTSYHCIFIHYKK